MEIMENEIGGLKNQVNKVEGLNNTIIEMLVSLGAKLPEKRDVGGSFA